MEQARNGTNARGTLTVYLGYAVGVGKTFGMLAEAQECLHTGADIVIGYLEPHGRPETQEKAKGIEVVSPKRISYRGITLKETDADGIILRNPSMVLIDEIAHTNAPGSEFEKRHRDIERILAAGIPVTTTLNMQHLDSIAPLAEQELGIRVSERIPDAIIAHADRIVPVNIPVRHLIRRLKDGKIYDGTRIEVALNGFFRKENLKYLRNTLEEWLRNNNRTAG